MTGPVFVDANVFIYARDKSESRKLPRARAWLDHLWRKDLGRTSMQVLSEYYVNVRRRDGAGLDADAAWGDVRMYLAWRPLSIDDKVALRAREIELRWRISWWDSMVVAAAQLQDCTVLLTEDLQDGMAFGSVTVRSPFTFEVQQPLAAYALPIHSAGLHRPRGRPRRSTLA